jgi:hypothetical protein
VSRCIGFCGGALKVRLALNVIAGAMISIPIIGFVISAIIKRADPTWISLGPVYPSSKRNPARNAVFVPSRLEDRPS